jgi:hypothetical protein
VNLSEFPAAFALLERCLGEGDEQAKELARVKLIRKKTSFSSCGAALVVKSALQLMKGSIEGSISCRTSRSGRHAAITFSREATAFEAACC